MMVRMIFWKPWDFVVDLLYRFLAAILRLIALMLPSVVLGLAHLMIPSLIACFVMASLIVLFYPRWLGPFKDGGDLPPIMRARASTITTTPKINGVSDIYHTAFLLKKAGLPGDVIPTIMDYAELWFSTALASSDREIELSGPNNGHICLVAPLPRGLPKGSLRTLSFTLHSKDMIEGGWHRGPVTSHPGNERSGIALSVLPDNTASRLDSDRFLFPPKRVQNNYHSCPNCYAFFAYERQWHYRSNDEEIAEIMSSLAGGQKLALIMCADDPSVCAVEFSRIECEIAVVRKM